MSTTTPQKIDSPGIWIGDELRQRLDWQYELNGSDIQALRSAAGHTRDNDIDSITRENFQLGSLANTLADIQYSLENESGATMIRGLPVGEIDNDEAARIYFGICQHLGTPISQSAAGEKIFHVRDAGFKDDDPRARGPNTKKRLSFHTDRCDVIAFLCLNKAQSGGENFVVHSAAVYNQILDSRPDLLAVLMQPFHYLRHTVDTGNESPFCRQPIFSFTEGHFSCSFLRVLIDRAHNSEEVPDLTDQQVEALDYLESVCEDESMHIRFYQEPGDILLLNNWITLHRRSEFVDHEEPELKRHLLRVWLSMPNSRPIDPLFKENFGATAAGAIRGGMRAKK
jgi:alpha-ketoglutarate-dependent taurine dioxygenase